jgi:hypothetical protein
MAHILAVFNFALQMLYARPLSSAAHFSKDNFNLFPVLKWVQISKRQFGDIIVIFKIYDAIIKIRIGTTTNAIAKSALSIWAQFRSIPFRRLNSIRHFLLAGNFPSSMAFLTPNSAISSPPTGRSRKKAFALWAFLLNRS